MFKEKFIAIFRLLFLIYEYTIAGLRVIIFDNYIITGLSWNSKKISKSKIDKNKFDKMMKRLT